MTDSSSPRSLMLFSPSKVNLFFRVLRRRADGFHQIASLFQALDLGDFLFLQLDDHDVLTCNHRAVPEGPANLIWKAVNAFRENTGIKCHVRAHLFKVIPLKAGLGGGSSNAATALWGLNALLAHPCSVEELAQIGSQCGSDIPFFFSLGSAYCQGRGEVVEAIPPLDRFFQDHVVWLALNSLGVSTPAVYGACNPASMPEKDLSSHLDAFQHGKALCFNDLEATACQLEPSLETIRVALHSLPFTSVSMTGSGSAFICLAPRKDADAVLHSYKAVEALQNVQLVEVAPAARPSDEWYCSSPLSPSFKAALSYCTEKQRARAGCTRPVFAT